jgi:phosphoenolpyruvate carboxylase
MSSKSAVEAAIDAYEAAIRRTSDAQRRLAERVPFEPARALLRYSADLTRDIGAAQLSRVRWLLDA